MYCYPEPTVECNFAQEVDPLFLGEKNVVPSGQTGFESPKKLIWDKDFQTSNKKFWWHSDFLTIFGSDHQNESEHYAPVFSKVWR